MEVCRYYQLTETGFYYLQSRYYDPIVKRFLNADSYASTGQGFLGYNMFAYCNNNPVIATDYCGQNAMCLQRGSELGYYCDMGGGIFTLWLLTRIYKILTASSKPVPSVVTPAAGAQPIPQSEAKSIVGSTPATPPNPNGNNGKKEQNSDIKVPDVKYPGDDPTQPPGDNYEWRGPDPQGGKRGGYVNIDGSDSWHPDLDHPDGIGPHWDYNDPFGHKWRVYPDWIEFVH